MSAESFYKCKNCGGRVLDYSLCPHCARQADAATRTWRHSADPSTFNSGELAGAIYALQSERGDNSVRIRALMAEQQRRRDGAASASPDLPGAIS